MLSFSFHNLLEILGDPRTVWGILWSGIVVLTIALLVLMRTRWGQAKPLSKCIVLSVAAHILLMGYAHMTQLFIHPPTGRQTTYHVVLASDMGTEAERQTHGDGKPWNQQTPHDIVSPNSPELPHQVTAPPLPTQTPRTLPTNHSTGMTSDASPSEAPISAIPTQALTTTDDLATSDALPAENIEREDSAKPPSTAPAALTHSPPRIDDHSPPIVQHPHRTTSDSNDSQAERIHRLADLVNVDNATDAASSPVDVPVSANPAHSTDTIASANHPSNPTEGDVASESRHIATTPISAVVLPNTTQRPGDGQQVPSTLALRGSEDRDEIARRFGGSAETEAAVDAALQWLAAHQENDGRWDAYALGAGRQQHVEGQDRGRAGAQADTGITALAMLAYLGAGHTHYEGPYRTNVQHGLEYLLRNQADDGNLAGDASLYARMYCHGMATIAISEAYAMTGDVRLLPFVRRAVNYTIAAQHPTGGGWRYRPGDRGDMSQCGWQLMALKSADLAGVEVPAQTFTRVQSFMHSCARGTAGGLASYRPGERVSTTMTAESLACRIFLGDDDEAAIREAVDFILSDLPDSGKANLYYWYYASLALFQLQGDEWKQWNDALQPALLNRQRDDGDLSGSWDPDSVWGPHGGRVYSTAMACLCLEVYYRYLPLYMTERDDEHTAVLPRAAGR